MTDDGTRRRGRGALVLLVPVALLASSAVVYQASNAAFTASTDNAANSWTSGTVAIEDDDAGAALFSATGLKPGDTGSACIVVTYTGTLTAAVRLYATSYADGGLAPYLDLSVDEGTGSARDCSDFTASGSLYAGTLSGFATTYTGYAAGASAWAPAGGSNAGRTFRFTWTLQDTDAAQGATAGTAFTWEAQNT